MRFLLVAALKCHIALVGLASFTPKPKQVEQELSYDSAIVVDVTGVVADVREVLRDNPLAGLHLLLSTHTEVLDIYLGPAEYLKEFDVAFSKGAFVQIIGSKVNFSGGRVVLAREVRQGKTTLYLRDRTGQPNWPTPETTTEGASRPQ